VLAKICKDSSVPNLTSLLKIRRPKVQKVGTSSSLSLGGSFLDVAHHKSANSGRLLTGKSSRLISESLAYSLDSHFDILHMEQKEVSCQTCPVEPNSVACQTDVCCGELGWECRRCARPPRPKPSGRKRFATDGDAADLEEVSERELFNNFASPAEALLHDIQGMWTLHQGPDTTASWLRSFLVRGRVAESEEDWLEIRIQDDTVYMAGGELSLDEEGRLHRFGQSGTHLVYTRLDEPPPSS